MLLLTLFKKDKGREREKREIDVWGLLVHPICYLFILLFRKNMCKNSKLSRKCYFYLCSSHEGEAEGPAFKSDFIV